MSRYLGTVTDKSWTQSVLRLSWEDRKNYIKTKLDKKLEEGFDFIFSLRRLPRIYTDEYKTI